MLQLGDFGIGRRSAPTFIDTIERLANTLDLRVLITPGSYDDWSALRLAFRARPQSPLQLTEHIYALPRGCRFTIAGRRFLSFGGGASARFVDAEAGSQTVVPTAVEVDRSVAAGAVDVLLLHEAVDDAVRQVATKIRYEARRQRQSASVLEASRASRALVTDLRNRLRPAVTLHAHMHTRGAHRDAASTVISLSRESRSGNVGFLYLPTLQFTWLEQATSQAASHAH
ncbi:hypothetical protein [Curtobacterium sp. NPDC089689]|uniref:hypothetical protein n=1 Tax=Curtobacterium sp. NPDC089689 TaxID=3363968 RepID=UPI0038236BD9